VLEAIPAERMGEAALEVLRRLAPLLRAAGKQPPEAPTADAVRKALQRAK
jgi:hypothetical protein